MPIGLLLALHEAIVEGNRAHLTASGGDALMLHNFSEARDHLQGKLIETKFQCKERANVERDLPPMLLKAINEYVPIGSYRLFLCIDTVSSIAVTSSPSTISAFTLRSDFGDAQWPWSMNAISI